jgi:hypothetical protein
MVPSFALGTSIHRAPTPAGLVGCRQGSGASSPIVRGDVERKQNLADLTPKGSFVAIEALERSVVERGET